MAAGVSPHGRCWPCSASGGNEVQGQTCREKSERLFEPQRLLSPPKDSVRWQELGHSPRRSGCPKATPRRTAAPSGAGETHFWGSLTIP